MQRPWHGNGPMNDSDRARGEDVWPIVAPSALPTAPGWLVPHELTLDEIAQLKQSWEAATRRALAAGFEVVEVHGAHGYLLHSFLSPISNKRTDRYGGSLEGRRRLPLEIAQLVRSLWPADKPVFYRISSVDGAEGGSTIEDSVGFVRELKQAGIDVIDCSSGGIGGSATAAGVKRTLGFQVPFSERIRRDAQIPTMTVGLIIEPHQAEQILQSGQADLIAIGRQALFNPNWPLHAEIALGVENEFASWPVQAGWWLDKRQRSLNDEDARRATQPIGAI
jgi:2,4-dienoyl-CoA reductase-like NADH-dependent reductase (Old Yellow Enzyme family)